jgi:MoaA/NifB/PqqE/SkfB family radical SAM enzyme
MISTNGDYLKGPEDIEKYFDAGLNQFLVNIYSASDKSLDKKIFDKGVEKAGQRYATIKEWMHRVSMNYSIGLSDLSIYQNIGPKKRTMDIKRKYGVQKDVVAGNDNDFESISNRAGNIEGFKEGTKEPLAKHCTKPFRFLNINWTGEALLCCNDFYAKTSMGNVADMSLVDIWNCERFNKYRLRLQNKNRNQPMCVGCDSNGGYYPHMINKVTFGKTQDKELLNPKFLDI